MHRIHPRWWLSLLFLVLATVGPIASHPAAAAAAAPPDAATQHMRLPWVREKGFITAWLICGEFPVAPNPSEGESAQRRARLETDFLREHGGEAAIRPQPGMTHTRADGSAATWTSVTSPKGSVDLRAAFAGRPNENVVAYAFATISRPEPGKALLAIGSDDGVRVWVNGRLVHDHAVSRGLTPDQDLAEVTLDAGENRILVKVEQGIGDWGFSLRVAGHGEARAIARRSLSPSIETGAAAQPPGCVGGLPAGCRARLRCQRLQW